MKVMDYNMLPNGANTKTMQDLGSIIGLKPELSKAVVTLYPNLSLSNLTELLGGVYKQSGKDMKGISSFAFEWMIKTNQIPRIKFAEDCTETGAGGTEFAIILEKKYYDPHDTFKLDNDQHLFVKRVPEMLAPNKWKYWVKLVGGDSTRIVNVAYMTRGKETLYVSNYHPELSEKGYSKFMYNIEKHRNYISRHRVGDSWSGDWAALKTKYLEHAGVFFKMNEFEKDLMDQFYLARERSMLLGVSNFDAAGKCLDYEADGRIIPMGDGLIEQIRKFCGQQRYNVLTRTIFDNAISDVVSKMEKKTGNNIVVMCNWRMFQQAQIVLDDLLKTRAADAYFYSASGGKLKVGATYNAYEWAGNTITFMENTALTLEYPDKGYGVFVDTSINDGEPNIQMMTLEGRQLIKGTLKGMGGLDGKSSGDISTTVDGSRMEFLGYSGIKVANPYSSHIIQENVS